MATLKFKNVVSFSSQDPVHKVFNLLEQNTQFKRWLCAPDDKTGRLQAEFQLEKASKIGFVDIGNYGSAFVEVQVRRSSWPDGKSVTMIPATMMMTPQHCKIGKNKCTVKMFSKDQLSEESVKDSWDRIKVICTQPYKKDAQFGLAFIRLAAAVEVTDEQGPEAPGPTMKKLADASPSLSLLKKPTNRILSPSWKTNAAFHRQVIATTKKEQNDVGLQNRLLKISSTSENGTDNEGSLGRAAKLVMAAAGSGKKQNSADSKATRDRLLSPAVPKNVTKTPVDKPTAPSRGSNLENTDVDKPFSDLVEDFLKSTSDDKLKHSTLKAIRYEFEKFIGRKLTTPEKAELKSKAILAVGRLVSEDKSTSSPKSTSSNASTPKVQTTQSLQGKWSPTGSSPHVKPPTKYQSPTVGANKPNNVAGKKYELNNNYATPSPKRFSSPKITTPKSVPNQQSKVKSSSSPNMNSPKPTFNYYGANGNHYTPLSSTPKSAPYPDQRRLPKSHQKRSRSPSPDWHEQYLNLDQDGGNKRAKMSVNSPKEDDDGWLQASKPTTSSTPSTPSTSKVPTNRDLPPWMAVGSPSTSVTPTRGRGRGGGRGQGRGTPGERKPCPKCNKSFTSTGLGRHMAKCTGPKQRRQSRGRGRGGARGGGRISQQPGVSNSSTSNDDITTETGSNFGLTTTDLVKCPMCDKDFPLMLIELHAEMCGVGEVGDDMMFGGAQNMEMGFAQYGLAN
ncbi:uncharacterized protein [Amphiura filiformis]|uniref:uncharacterized protein n=1 Tax=Amphiura filiformis TaxID=82378 RepID=UPI003B21D4F4